MNTAHLPTINEFVTAIVPRMRSISVAVDLVSARILVTRAIPGIALGTPVTFDYRNGYGHFRFAATCCETNATSASFTLPSEIRTIELFAQSDFALQALIDMKWRYAPDGVGNGRFITDKLTSLSPGGGAFILSRDLRQGTLFDLHIRLDHANTIERIARLVTTDQIEARGGVYGKIVKKIRGHIEFSGTSAADDRVIADFIDAHQARKRPRCA